MLYSRNQIIGKYKVIFPIKHSTYAETYRVKGSDEKIYFLKLFNYAKLHPSQFDNNGQVLELTMYKSLHHSNLPTYHDSGDLIKEGVKLGYIVLDFISGETVAEKMQRESIRVYEAKQIAIQVLNALHFLHSQNRCIVHNEVSIQNTMIDMSQEPNVAKLIDFGHARYIDQERNSFDKCGVNLFTLAPETFNGVFTPQSDVYAVGAMLYQMLFKMPPYFVDIPRTQKSQYEVEELVLQEKSKPLKIPNLKLFELDDTLLSIISCALSYDVDMRFKNAEEFAKALKGEIRIKSIYVNSNKNIGATKQSDLNVRKGNGFKDVAGMKELKQRMKDDVIDLLLHPEENKALGIPMPNGILLYGPPGCGKTFFAEKFAEESGYNYMYVKCSDVASPYIHGGQEKIAALFDQARENAPTILFLDEVEAMIMSREKHNNVSEAGEVNEFLTQLNNCGENRVLVIAATNQPNSIDAAALRAGRLEMKYYIPNPDAETRLSLLRLYLEYRADFGIDYAYLVDRTQNFVASDIKLLADNAARNTRRAGKRKITMDILKETLQEYKPTVSLDEIRRFEKIRDQFEGKKEEARRIGFN